MYGSSKGCHWEGGSACE